MTRKYLVGIREVWVRTVVVEADSPEEAVAFACGNEDSEVLFEYGHTLDMETWSVDESENPNSLDIAASRQEAIAKLDAAIAKKSLQQGQTS